MPGCCYTLSSLLVTRDRLQKRSLPPSLFISPADISPTPSVAGLISRLFLWSVVSPRAVISFVSLIGHLPRAASPSSPSVGCLIDQMSPSVGHPLRSIFAIGRLCCPPRPIVLGRLPISVARLLRYPSPDPCSLQTSLRFSPLLVPITILGLSLG